MVKPTTIRLILSLTLSHGWSLRQLDVNNAFLYGTLSDEVYMQQPLGFVDHNHPTHVCKLCKAIYDLKQAPRAWYTELKGFLLSYGFINSFSDASLFIYRKHGVTLYFLVYVDDLIVIGNNNAFLVNFLQALATRFSIKDLGDLHYFLVIEVLLTPSGLLLTQHKYIRDLLDRTNMVGAKECTSPMSSTQSLQLHDGSPPTDSTKFCQVIGALQYLSLTRPNISYVVNKLAKFMHSPTKSHKSAAKHLLRYLKCTIHHDLFLKKHQNLCLTAFSYADWASDHDDCTSTYAYIVYLGGNAISWCSKKQKIVACSSTEAKYRALASCAAKVLWVQNLLKEL